MLLFNCSCFMNTHLIVPSIKQNGMKITLKIWFLTLVQHTFKLELSIIMNYHGIKFYRPEKKKHHHRFSLASRITAEETTYMHEKRKYSLPHRERDDQLPLWPAVCTRPVSHACCYTRYATGKAWPTLTGDCPGRGLASLAP